MVAYHGVRNPDEITSFSNGVKVLENIAVNAETEGLVLKSGSGQVHEKS